MGLKLGATGEVERVVTPEITADALGNPGVTVLATPFVVSLIENAAIEVLKDGLPPGAASVGTRVEIKHLAATPEGMRVRAKATLTGTDGRRLLFHVEVFDEVEKIAEATHERFIIPSLQNFLDRAMRKGTR
jgi:fluoroacetyl-CoA thioesterase